MITIINAHTCRKSGHYVCLVKVFIIHKLQRQNDKPNVNE